MSDWIHCNKCFKQPAINGDKFHLTNCGHFICATCATEKPNYCFECQSKCATTILTSNLNEDIRRYFDNFDLQLDQIKSCLKIMEFQKNHRQKLFAHIFEENIRNSKELKSLLYKYNAAKDYIKKVNGRKEELQKENKRLKDIIKNNMRLTESASSSSKPDGLIMNGRNRKSSLAINLQTPTNDNCLTPTSANFSFFSNKNKGNVCSSNASSIRSTSFLTTPSPSTNIPFQSLFINSNDCNNPLKRN